MWIGVSIGFAGLKFSGSPRRNGVKKHIIIKIDRITEGAKISFHEKYGWKVIFSLLFWVPRGFEDPVS